MVKNLFIKNIEFSVDFDKDIYSIIVIPRNKIGSCDENERYYFKPI